MTEIGNVKRYTEAAHTVYGDVTGAIRIPVPTASLPSHDRHFAPERVTVHYHWRTQLDHDDWRIGNIEISGRWVDTEGAPTGTGSGRVIVDYESAPQWARDFADATYPTTRLVG